jgi:hypothetical protein
MQDALTDFQTTIDEAAARLGALGEEEVAAQRGDDGWSGKQILGHLIDSAANNHRRFVLAQMTDHLAFEGYEQNGWVSVQRYDAEPWAQLVALWRAYNLHLLHVMAHADAAKLKTPCTQHTLDRIAWQTVSAAEPVTLEYLMRDYIGHMKHHLEQILER